MSKSDLFPLVVFEAIKNNIIIAVFKNTISHNFDKYV